MQLNHWIYGRSTPAPNGARLDVYEPANGRVLGQVAAGDDPDVPGAVAAAHAGRPA